MNDSEQRLPDELESQPGSPRQFENWLEAHSNLSAILIVTAGFLIRLRALVGNTSESG